MTKIDPVKTAAKPCCSLHARASIDPDASRSADLEAWDDEGGPTRLLMAALIIALVIVILFATLLIDSAANAADQAIVVRQAWSRATPGGSVVAGGYLTVENNGSASDRLLLASTDIAKKVEIHEMAVRDGVMTMRPVDGGLVIEPGQTLKFAPGGLHLMIVGLFVPLAQGDKVPVTLKFEKAGEINVSFDVQGMGAPAPGPLGDAAGPAIRSTAKM